MQAMPASTSGSEGRIVGVTEVSWQTDAEVVDRLGECGAVPKRGGGPPHPTSGFYPYLSCMAVLPAWRRKRVASALIAEAEREAERWGFRYIALHVYAKNDRARELYSRCGYEVVEVDPWWRNFPDERRELRVKWLNPAGRQRAGPEERISAA